MLMAFTTQTKRINVIRFSTEYHYTSIILINFKKILQWKKVETELWLSCNLDFVGEDQPGETGDSQDNVELNGMNSSRQVTFD